MAEHARESLAGAIALRGDYSEEGYLHVCDLETLIDQYEDALGSYLLRITPTELNAKQNEDLHKFLHTITDFERVGDHCSNVAVALIEIRQDLFDTHEYVDSLKLIKDEAFGENYERFRAKYSLD